MSKQLLLVPAEPPKSERQMIPLDELPKNLIGDEPTSELVESIRMLNLKEPIQVAPVRAGFRNGWEILTGKRRVKALRKLYAETGDERFALVPAEVTFDLSPAQRAALSITLHATRNENVAAELQAVEMLMSKGATAEDLRKATGLPAQTIKHHQKMINWLIPEIRSLLSEAKISPSVAESASKLKPSVQQKLLQKYETAGKITAKDIHEVKMVIQGEAKKQLPSAIFSAPESVSKREAMEKLQSLVARMIVGEISPDDAFDQASEVVNFVR